MHFLNLSVIIIATTLSSCTFSTTENTAPVENRGELFYGQKGISKFIEVNDGENIFDIAKEYNVSSRDLIKINGLSKNNKISQGMVLKLPTENFYRIKKGDLLRKIARQNNTTSEHLVELNDLLNEKDIKPGDLLKIPHKQSVFIMATKHSEYLPPQSVATKTITTVSIEKAKQPNVIKNKKYFKLNSPLGNKNYIWPLEGKVLVHFGKNGNNFNEGINIEASKGSAVLASSNGKVIYIGNDLDEYGKLVIVQHANNFMTAYAHVSSVLVKKGQSVKQGQKIAKVGDTGYVKSPQLYFSVRKSSNTIDPEKSL